MNIDDPTGDNKSSAENMDIEDWKASSGDTWSDDHPIETPEWGGNTVWQNADNALIGSQRLLIKALRAQVAELQSQLKPVDDEEVEYSIETLTIDGYPDAANLITRLHNQNQLAERQRDEALLYMERPGAPAVDIVEAVRIRAMSTTTGEE